MPTAITLPEPQPSLQIDFSQTTPPLLTDDFGVLDKFLNLVQSYLHQTALPISKIEVGGFADPEEDSRQYVVTLRGSFLLEQGAEYLDALGSFVEDWMRTLPEAEQAFFLAHVTFRFQQERNVITASLKHERTFPQIGTDIYTHDINS